MLICGIKITHDAGVAVIEDDHLLFSIEFEKLGNNPRYSSIQDLRQVAEILQTEGVKPSEVDQFVVDGWFVEGARTAELLRGRCPVPLVLPPGAGRSGEGTGLPPAGHHQWQPHRLLQPTRTIRAGQWRSGPPDQPTLSPS